MAENSRKSSENRRMQWLSGSNNIGDSFYTFTTTKESGYEQSGRFDVKQRIAHLYHKQLYTDVTFFIKCDAESNSTLHAHKAILAAGSQYFAQMLFESQDILSETTEPVKQVQISGISPEAFKNVIEFLYTDEICSDNDALVMETFLAAKQFEIQPLIDRCVSHLEEIELSKFVVCSMLQIAIQR
ncbi:BTB/POZ domain-containing protein 6, partial [Stegodyphus mimosarum]